MCTLPCMARLRKGLERGRVPIMDIDGGDVLALEILYAECASFARGSSSRLVEISSTVHCPKP